MKIIKVSAPLVDYSSIFNGMRVKDSEQNIGTIKECEDIHNVLVLYDNGGTGFHCLAKDCIENKSIAIDGIYTEISYYDPLYYYDETNPPLYCDETNLLII